MIKGFINKLSSLGPRSGNRGSRINKETTLITAGLPVHARNDSKRGAYAFTLIELLVVVLIIGILSAIALPQYEKTVLKSRMVKGLVGLASFETAQKEYRLANGSYTSDPSNLAVTQTCFGSCGTFGSTSDGTAGVYCDCSVKSGVLNVEWQGQDSSGKTLWICYAKIGNQGANSVCSSYQKEWGGTSTTNSNGYTYYYGAWK